MKRIPWMAGLFLLLAASASRAGEFAGDQLVKTSASYFEFSEDGYLWPFNVTCSQTSFEPASPVQIAPGSGDPGAPTSNPFTFATCPIFDSNGDGQAEFHFSLRFNSLRDLGRKTIVCNGTHVDPAYCWSAVSPPCNVVCDLSRVSNFRSPAVFRINVVNSPPNASPSHTPTPAWNATVTLRANSTDPDGGGLNHAWRIVSKPPMSTATLANANTANATITFTSDRDIGSYQFAVDISDNEGELKTFTHSFSVPNVPPNITVAGATELDANTPINLTASPTTDVDGGALTFTWDILEAPPRSGLAPTTGYATTPGINIPTTGLHVGTWRFRVTARDNEGDTDSETVTVTVRNLKPRIALTGPTEIDVGQTLQAATSVLTDDDGGNLTFKWELFQAPQSAGVAPLTVLSSIASVSRPTTASSAGTWIVRLTVTDDEGESVHEDRSIVVDDVPTASITGLSVAHLLEFPLVLDGRGSNDPDSPCPTQAHRCHVTDGSPVRNISPGIVQYTWYVVDIPPEAWGAYTTGRVDEVFFVPANQSTLSLDWADMEPGQWQFELEVQDGEGNVARTRHTVTVVPPQTPPTAVVSGSAWYLVNLAGVLPGAIVVDGSASFDLDNLTTGTPGSGLGITQYAWSAVPPAGCTAPSLPSAPSASVLTLYAAGATVPPACQGFWRIRLTVTDDDSSPLTHFAETGVTIGNCVSGVCVDAPTTLTPAIVQSFDGADIDIYYHIDSTLYEHPVFSLGMYTLLEVLPTGSGTPVYTAMELSIPPMSKGLPLVFNWNGYTHAGTRPPTGRYDVRVTLLDFALAPTAFSGFQPQAIQTEVVTLQLASSAPHLERSSVVAGTGSVTFDYRVDGAISIDSLQWRVRNGAGSVVTSGNTPSPAALGAFSWNGRVGATPQAPGRYEMELEAFRSGRSLGVSPRVPFYLYELGLEVPGHAIPATGLPVAVNSDDDDANGVDDSAQSPAPAGENDLVAVTLRFQPRVDGQLTLSSDGAALFKVWTSSAKTQQLVLPKTFNLPAEAVPAQVYIEGLLPGAPQLRVEYQPPTGAALPRKELKLNLWHLATLKDANNDFRITGADAPTSFVRVGLWDGAFRLAADGFGLVDTLYNESDQVRLAASGNPENFIGRDSRRFYYQLTDAARNTNAGTVEEYALEWFTTEADGVTNQDYPATNRTLTLTETGPNTGVFVSQAVMVVADPVDRDVATNTGLTAHPGAAAYDAAEHRVRQVKNPDGRVVARYQPVDPATPASLLKTPLFQRSVEERRAMTVRVFNFQDPTNLGIAAIPAATVNQVTQLIQERYIPLGIRVEIIHNPVTDVISLPAGSAVNLNNVAGFTGSIGTLAPSADQQALINLARGVDPAGPANADTLYLLFVGNFTSGDRGQSFPDGWIPAGSAARNFVFAAGRAPSLDYTGAHEVGHMLTNATLTHAQAAGTEAGWAGGGHYGGAHDVFNLMRNGTISSVPLQHSNTKRLWDDTAVHTVQQITRARSTRFLRNP
ncbi:Ig-like domain-containing protein [Myxococcus sp. RHSTA-1-4]|uniref:Ig-like domain-containing protein n=1 Tax=Myxococcus sp. RHSTA-1-4 TaxID=2874601 RepID=UPI001CBE45D7|nr:Ig-like domain-containing protein [Myxococcus sp. RHSTA-1-4]MBZ4417636.1 PKD domain-containing protein [Myxococcus sp. RHSTA-1-4]